ncbi:unnamed protein product [Cyclocybe aegerita]|uniref:SET domain-containing protein n=1 Tax=Cyclocybe aegerita TaxID=1973307 RepID=A0A8S0VXY3_CYCAE|nr:unnamed protein product [Cyclocybe aegerita]
MSLTDTPYSTEHHPPSATVLALLPHPSDEAPPPICPISPAPPSGLVSRLFARFGNNNFAIHSHLVTIGHGVFPFASRLFNHSCIPNAAAKYRLSPGQSVIMEVVALRDILPGEEICIPYLDPALLQTRDNILQISYGFKCKCLSCQFIDRIQPLPKIPETVNEFGTLAKQLCEFVGIGSEVGSILPSKPMDGTPPPLRCVFREEYMTRLSDSCSKSAHEGQYPLALESGLTLLALYILVYPQNYPQIGVHLLEMAKTAWNAMVSSPHDSRDEKLEEHMRALLLFARRVLMVFGPEGDEVGPLQEIEVLEEMLRNEQ